MSKHQTYHSTIGEPGESEESKDNEVSNLSGLPLSFYELVEKEYEKSLSYTQSRYSGVPSDIREEYCQEAWSRIAKQVCKEPEQTYSFSYFKMVLHNYAIDTWKKKDPLQKAETKVKKGSVEEAIVDQLPSPQIVQEKEMVRQEILASMSPKQQEFAKLKEAGYKNKEIMEIMEFTSWGTLQHFQRNLRNGLRERGYYQEG